MMEEEDANPLPPGTDSSAHQPADGAMSETTTTVMDSASNSDVVASHVVNDVIATTITTQPKNTPLLQSELEMLEEDPNPLLPGTDSSAHQQAGGTMNETTSAVMHSAGNSDFVASHVVNDVIATTQPKNTPLLQSELEILEEDANPLLPGTVSSAHQQDGGTMSETTTTVMDSAGNLDVVASHVVNDVIATTTTTTKKQPPNTPALQCDICKITCDTQDVLERHKLGKKHLKTLQKLAEASAIDKPLAGTDGLKNATSECSSSSSSGTKSTTFQCQVCKISCNSNELLNMHFSGKKHLKKLKQSEEIPNPLDQPESTEGKSVELHQGKPLSCDLCGIACTSYDTLKQHNSGKKHQKNLENSLKPIGPNPAPAMEAEATAPMMIGPLQDEGDMVKADGSNGKAKRARPHEDVKTKKQKLLHGGASNALSRCALCSVVCTSPNELITHFAGKKHMKMALKQAEADQN